LPILFSLLLVIVFARYGGRILLELVRSVRTAPCSVRPSGLAELLACPPSGGPALFPPIRPVVDWGLNGRLASGLGGNVHPYVLGLAVAGPSDFGPGVAWACGPKLGLPAGAAGVGIRPLVNLNTGYQPYSLPQ